MDNHAVLCGVYLRVDHRSSKAIISVWDRPVKSWPMGANYTGSTVPTTCGRWFFYGCGCSKRRELEKLAGGV